MNKTTQTVESAAVGGAFHIEDIYPLVDGGLNLKWGHLGADNTSLFLKDDDFRAAITRWDEP